MSRDFHPIADIFPLMEGEDYAALVEDVRVRGLLSPILLHPDGRVIDGRNRYRACRDAHVEPQYVEWSGDDKDLLAYVLSLNLHRRHLDESQRAMVAGRVETLAHGQKKSDLPIGISRPEAAQMLNVGERTVARARVVQDDGVPELIQAVDQGRVAVSLAAKVAELKPDEQRTFVSSTHDGATPSQAYRAVAHSVIARERSWPDGRYGVIYADPPWEYANSGFTQSAAAHYPTMPTDAICELPVRDLATDDSVCLLWVTSPLLPDGLRVLRSWGFDYKASMVWVKDRAPGIGWWVQTKHELLLIGSRGNLRPDVRPVSILSGGVSEHSRKPDETYAVAESMFPLAPKVELFARGDREGWTRWGNE